MTTDLSFHSTFLHFGDVIALYAEGEVSGFLGTMGLVDDRCVVRVGNGSLEEPPQRFRDSLFRLCPISRYQAQNNYHRAHTQFSKSSADVSVADPLLLQRLRVAADKEREQNAAEAQKMVGQELTYGALVQLFHLKSHKYVTANMREPALVERNATRVHLDAKSDEGAWFSVEPYFKLRSTGDKVVVGDRVRLCPANTQSATSGGERHQLHISVKPMPTADGQQEGSGGSDVREVNCLNESRVSWRTVLFLDYKEYRLDCLKSGDVMRLFHTEQQMFLTLDEHERRDYVYLRRTARSNALEALNPKALWEVEVVQNDPCRGALGRWTSVFRFKHMATDSYLAAEVDPDGPPSMPHRSSGQHLDAGRVYHLIPVGHSHFEKATLFELDACTVTQPDAVVSRSAFVRLRHLVTGTWAHSTRTLYDQTRQTKEREMYKVECIHTKEDREAFALMPVSVDEVRDLDFANDAFEMLNPFADKLRVNDVAQLPRALDGISHKERAAIVRLLGELVVFLASGHTGDPLHPDFFAYPLVKPNRDRQKLIREQNVLATIFDIVKTSQDNLHLRTKGGASSDQRVANSWRHMYQLCHVVLRLSQLDYRKTQEFMAKKYFGVLQEEIGLGVRAEDTIAALVNGNPKLLNEMKCIDQRNIQTFVRLVKEHRQAKFLDYLSTLCVSRGEAVAKIQELVCDEVLDKPDNLNLLIRTQCVRNAQGDITGVVLVWAKGSPEGTIRQSLHTVAGHRSYREMLLFYEHQLNMFSQMCLGRQYKALNSTISDELPVDLMLQCMKDDQLSYSLRAAFTRLMVHLHVDREPQEPVTAVRYARLWTDIPERISVDVYDAQEKTYVESGGSRQASREQFAPTIRFVDAYLRDVKKQGFRNQEQNQLTHEVVLLANSLIHFGFYSLRELLELCHDLLELLDPDEQVVRTLSPSPIVTIRRAPLLRVLGADGVAHAPQESVFAIDGSRESAPQQSRCVANTAAQEAVTRTKLTILDIFLFVKNIRLDYRVSVVLSLFKRRKQRGEDVGEASDNDEMRQLTSEIFGMAGVQAEHQAWLDLDKEGGAQLLRVLISLSLDKSPALVSSALGLLFLHFAQRQDLLNAFRSLQLLVSAEDRKNYDTVRQDLMVMKDLVEKSELWMKHGWRTPLRSMGSRDNGVSTPGAVRTHRSTDRDVTDADVVYQGDDEFGVCLLPWKTAAAAALAGRGGSNRDDPDAPDEKDQLRDILERLTAMCYKNDGGGCGPVESESAEDVGLTADSRTVQRLGDTPDPRTQQLLRNMRVQEVVLELLAVPYEQADKRMGELIALAHRFLQAFCNQNKENQEYLHARVAFGGVSSQQPGACLRVDSVDEVRTLCAIFRDNSQLCTGVPDGLVRHIVEKMEQRREHRNAVFLQFLDVVCKSDGQPHAETQKKVIEELSSAGDDVLLLYNEPATRERLVALLNALDYNLGDAEDELAYHLQLVRLLTRTVEGENEYTEIKCASLLTLDDIAHVTRMPTAPYELKDAYVVFLTHCYIDACADMLRDKSKLWPIVAHMLDDVVELSRARNADVLESYIASTVCYFLGEFMERLKREGELPGREHEVIEQVQPWQGKLGQLMKELKDLEQAEWMARGARYQIGECVKKIAKAYLSIMKSYQALLKLLDTELKPEVDAEFSVLVDVLNKPQVLFQPDSNIAARCHDGGFLARLVSHCKHLLHDKHQEPLCVRLLQTFQRMTLPITEHGPQAQRVRATLLARYVAPLELGKPGKAVPSTTTTSVADDERLRDVQNRLDRAGASDLLVEIVTRNPSPKLFQEAMQFGISLLQGGNTVVQTSLYSRLKSADQRGTTEAFFTVFHDKVAQAEQKVRTQHAHSDAWFKAKSMASPAVSTASSNGKKAALSLCGSGSHTNLSMLAGLEGGRTASLGSASDSLAVPDIRAASSMVDESSVELDLNVSGASSGDALGGMLLAAEHDVNARRGLAGDALPAEVQIMSVVLRFLQLLCENHNRELQNFLRDQRTKNNCNLVAATLQLLDCLCGSTPGSLGLLGYYINQDNVHLITQAIITLTEYCQGPCHENQDTLLNEANGLDMIISLLLNEITPLADQQPELVLQVKSNASILLLAIMESREDTENADRILQNMSRMAGGPQQLVASIRAAYAQGGGSGVVSVNSRKVGHNMYILAKQLAQHNKELASILDIDEQISSEMQDAALVHYGTHTAQVEIVRAEGVLERIVFPVPDKWVYLTPQTKARVFRDAESDKQGSKVRDFVSHFDAMYVEMKWQEELKSKPWLYPLSVRRRLWQDASYFLAVLINLLVAYAFPFQSANDFPRLQPFAFVLWPVMLMAFVITCGSSRRKYAFLFAASVALRLLLTFGVKPMVCVLGLAQLANKVVQLVSYCGNEGVFAKCRADAAYVRWRDAELVVLVMSVTVCFCGVALNPLWHSLLLFDIVYREETLRNVIKSVTRNWRSIAWTAMLAVILMYVFAIGIFIMFPHHLYIAPDDDDNGPMQQDHCALQEADCAGGRRVFVCDTLLGCLVETINCGLKGGGGVGECLQRLTPDDAQYHLRIMFDLSFFIVIVVIVLNLIFGVIIDTFADLRSEKQQKEDILENTCFICGLTRQAFENKAVTFEHHVAHEHNPWQYLYFWVLLLETDPTEFTGPQSYVHALMRDPNRKLDWFPRMRAMSLAVKGDTDPELSESRRLQRLLRANTSHVAALQQQLELMKRQMIENRSYRDRAHILHSTSLPGFLAPRASDSVVGSRFSHVA